MDETSENRRAGISELVGLVEQELRKLSEQQFQARTDLAHEIEAIDADVAGWSRSLSKNELSPLVRKVSDTGRIIRACWGYSGSPTRFPGREVRRTK